MGHSLRAIVGSRSIIADFAANWVWARLVPLPQDFALIPLTDVLHDDIVELANDPRPLPFTEFSHLSAEIEAVLRQESASGPIGYLETDYFGGIGTQAVLGWSNRTAACGPLCTESSWTDDGPRTEPPGERAVNQLLAWLGVRKDGERDEFDTLVLARFRDTESAAHKFGTRL